MACTLAHKLNQRQAWQVPTGLKGSIQVKQRCAVHYAWNMLEPQQQGVSAAGVAKAPTFFAAEGCNWGKMRLVWVLGLLPLHSVDDSICKCILCHGRRLWGEVSLQHLHPLLLSYVELIESSNYTLRSGAAYQNLSNLMCTNLVSQAQELLETGGRPEKLWLGESLLRWAQRPGALWWAARSQRPLRYCAVRPPATA